MRLTNATVVIRPRSQWEAMDLGIRLARRHAGLLMASWAIITLPLLGLLSALLWSYPSIAVLIFWLLKPAYERLPLYILSQALFGHTPSLSASLRALPGLLKPLTRYNQKTIYGLLFRAASQTLLELARDPKYLGAEIGFTAVLHTWGQNLTDHPHLHCIVPGGGLCATGQWANANKNFFIPVKVLSRKFKGKFLAYLREASEAGELTFGSDRHQHEQRADFNCLLNQLYDLEWVVFCKESFKNANSVIEYLGRYTHRVAISNHRIKSIRNGHVSFEWKDRIHNNQTKLMTLTGPEFLRRFLLHILPGRFMKIRHYGLLSNRNRVKVKRCQVLLKCLTRLAAKAKTNTREFLLKRLGIDIEQCPCCGCGKMIRRRKFDYQARHLLQ